MIPTSRRRALLMPLLILAVGCAVAWWSSLRHTREREEIGRTVTRLVQDVCAGRPVTLPIASAPAPGVPPLNDLLMEELGRACAEAGSPDAIEVQVNVGDAPDVGQAAGTATHTAVIRVRNSDRVLLVLRVRRTGQGAIVIAGYVMPPPPAPPPPPET